VTKYFDILKIVETKFAMKNLNFFSKLATAVTLYAAIQVEAYPVHETGNLCDFQIIMNGSKLLCPDGNEIETLNKISMHLICCSDEVKQMHCCDSNSIGDDVIFKHPRYPYFENDTSAENYSPLDTYYHGTVEDTGYTNLAVILVSSSIGILALICVCCCCCCCPMCILGATIKKKMNPY